MNFPCIHKQTVRQTYRLCHKYMHTATHTIFILWFDFKLYTDVNINIYFCLNAYIHMYSM